MAAKLNTSGQIQILAPTVSNAIPPAKTVRKVNIHTPSSPAADPIWRYRRGAICELFSLVSHVYRCLVCWDYLRSIKPGASYPAPTIKEQIGKHNHCCGPLSSYCFAINHVQYDKDSHATCFNTSSDKHYPAPADSFDGPHTQQRSGPLHR